MRWEILDFINKLDERGLIKGPILDVGGNGTEYQKEQGYDFRSKFKEKGMDYKILDKLNNPGVDFVTNACNFNLTKHDRPNTIFLTAMLEHCESPYDVMQSCFRNLKLGGIIFVTVPDMYGIHCAEDYFRFNENGLKILCKKFMQLQYGDFGTEEKRNLEHFFVGRKENTYGEK